MPRGTYSGVRPFLAARQKLRSHSDLPAVSPLDSSIAFLVGSCRELWLMGPNGENPTMLVDAKHDRIGGVAWSPSGTRVAYVRMSENYKSASIDTASVIGQPSTTVLTDPRLINSEDTPLNWLPGGRLVADLNRNYGDDTYSNLWFIATDPDTGRPTGALTQLTNWDGIRVADFSFSHDGSRLAVSRAHHRNDIYVGELKGGALIADSLTRISFSESANFLNGWTPNGDSLLFTSSRTGRTKVYRQHLRDSHADPLGPESSEESDAAQSTPNGAWLLYRSWKPGSLMKHLMRLPADGGPAEQIMELPSQESDVKCSSSPAGGCVMSVFQVDQAVFYSFDAVRGKGEEMARTNLSSASKQDWNISPDRSRIAVAYSRNHRCFCSGPQCAGAFGAGHPTSGGMVFRFYCVGA